MKTIIFSLLSLLLLSGFVYGQSTVLDVNGGVAFPQDSDTGFMIGGAWGRMVDENMGWQIGADYFWRTYSKEIPVKETAGTTSTTTIATEIENSTKMLPVMFKLVYLSELMPKIDLRLSGGIGYTFLWNSETNYKLDVEKSDFYSGFAWQVGAGISLPISRAADFYGEFNYLGTTPSKSEENDIEGLPVRTEIDMSGLQIRIGVRLYN